MKYQKSEYVWAKAQGYPDWPAKILKYWGPKINKYEVKFIGESNTATIEQGDIHPFAEAYEELRQASNKPKFLKAVKDTYNITLKEGYFAKKDKPAASQPEGGSKKNPKVGTKASAVIQQEDKKGVSRNRKQVAEEKSEPPAPKSKAVVVEVKHEEKDNSSNGSKRVMLRSKLDNKRNRNAAPDNEEKLVEAPTASKPVPEEARRSTRNRAVEVMETDSVQITGRRSRRNLNNPTNQNSEDMIVEAEIEPKIQPKVESKRPPQTRKSQVEIQNTDQKIEEVDEEHNEEIVKSKEAAKALEVHLEKTMFLVILNRINSPAQNQFSGFRGCSTHPLIKAKVAECLALNKSVSILPEHYIFSKIGNLWKFIMDNVKEVEDMGKEIQAIHQRLEEIKSKVWAKLTYTGNLEQLFGSYARANESFRRHTNLKEEPDAHLKKEQNTVDDANSLHS